MAFLTLRVLDGPERGKNFERVATPIAIGREEGNTIQLNDDRVSRFHLKIQEDGGHLVLTDLQSTNGTKVNGESVQTWILRAGDLISVGRSLLLVGSREQIAARLAKLRGANLDDGVLLGADDLDLEEQIEGLSFDAEILADYTAAEAFATLHTLPPPELPTTLSPGQTAQVAEVLQYLHFRVRGLLSTVQAVPKSDRVTLDLRQWENLLDIAARLARYVHELGYPDP